MDSAQARAQQGDKAVAACDVPPRTALDPRYRIDTLMTNPLPLAGVFPNEAGMDQSAEVRYDAYQFGSEFLPQAPQLLLNDTIWIDSAGHNPTPSFDALPSVTVPELMSIIAFLRMWSNCSLDNSSALDDLLTDFGFGWVCSPGDPFHALQSPVSARCPGGTISQMVGALPLGLMDARRLSETRVGIVVTDGSNYEGNGYLDQGFAQGSVWVLAMTDRGWRVDAIIGLVAVSNTGPPIVIPVDV